MLLAECEAGAVTRWQPCAVKKLAFLPETQREPVGARYQVESDRGSILTRSVVVATGGLSVPKIGASDFGWRVAAQFGLRTVPPRPGLVPLSFDAQAWAPWAELAGLSLPVEISTGEGRARAQFHEDLLFTHRGLSGPAVLQISSYWQSGTPIRINLAPGIDLAQRLIEAKARSRKHVANELSAFLPARLADTWVARDPAWQPTAR